MSHPNRILVVKLSAIGDVLLATPVARALREAFPNSYIAWVAERKSADVVRGNPYLDEVIIWDRVGSGNGIRSILSNIRGIMKLRSLLRSKKFDLCLDFQGLLKSAIITVASGARTRAGICNSKEMACLLYNKKYYPVKEIILAQQFNLNLLKAIGVESTNTDMYMPIAEEDRAFAKAFFEEQGLVNRRVLAFLPATTVPNKHWTVEGWARTAEMLQQKYDATGLIFGSKADLKLADSICNTSSAEIKVAAGKTTLKQAGALLELCDGVIGVDTGLLHMSMALNKPTVGVFGPTIWQCFTRRENVVYVVKDFPCIPCHRRPTCKDFDCMKAITAEDIDQALAKVL